MAPRADCLGKSSRATGPGPLYHHKKVAAQVVYHQSDVKLPYFAHQQLDPDYFPTGKSHLQP